MIFLPDCCMMNNIAVHETILPRSICEHLKEECNEMA